jgi:hypothetical protein
MTTATITDLEYEQSIENDRIRYQNDPIGFMVNCLDVKSEHIWSKMREVAESVRDNQLTAVPAGHDVSKTYTAGRLALWFKTCFQPSTVITTAPSDNQVRNQLWREIHTAYSGAKVPLGGKMTSLMWDVKPAQDTLYALESHLRGQWEKNFAIGFSTSPDTVSEHATKMQGWHNKWLFVILDEVCGIHQQITKAVIDSLIINKRCKVLALGNPTDPTSEFARWCESLGVWSVIPISVKDTPNFIHGREIIPGVAGRDYEKRIRETYGQDSNVYKYRVLGQFGDYREGTFYGKELALASKEGRVGNFPHEPTAKAYSFWDLGDMYTAGIFAQFIKGRIRIIDCYWDNQGLGLPEYAKVMQTKPYIWGKEHYAGPDLEGSNRKSMQTGRTTRDEAARLGMNLRPVFDHTFKDGIEAVRSIWPLLEINKPFCKVFLDAAKNYRKKKNEALSTDEQPVYHKQEADSWEKHMMDALRHLAMAYRYHTFDGRRLGYPSPIPYKPALKAVQQEYNPLNWEME